ncbi:MAG: serine hydrolase domain-containing protein [bacterium]
MIDPTNIQQRPKDIHIGNWRQYPYSKWAFHHVQELMPTAKIESETRECRAFPQMLQSLQDIQVKSPDGDQCSFTTLLEQNHADALLILHRGKIVAEWHAAYYDTARPHILFSVSKSVTGLLAGILEQQGLVDCEAPVADYLQLPKSCVYRDCTIRHLLDMTVALDFEENYSDQKSEYIKYRIATGWNPVDQTVPGSGLEAFLSGLTKSASEHGQAFLYRSPNTDLLGIILETAGNKPLAALIAQYLWKPMGAESEAYISLDRYGVARAAGGMCITLQDLARIGQLFLDNGRANDKQVISPTWLEDTRNNGDQRAWDKGNYKHKLPNGKYRNQWYQVGDDDGSISARGIHGQLLYINPTRSVVVAKLASQPEPLNDVLTASFFNAFDKIARDFGQ